MSQEGVLSVSSSGAPVVETLQGNSGGPVPPNAGHNIFVLGSGSINVTGNPGTNTLTISSTGLLSWTVITSSQALVSDHGYICGSPGGALILSLPPTSSLGDIIEVTLDGATSFTITQGAGQSIKMGASVTTTGVGGSLASTQQGDSIRIVCSVANLRWNVLSSMGNPTVV